MTKTHDKTFNVSQEEFAQRVAKVVAICCEVEGWVEQRRAIDAALADCPEFWREPIRVMGQGGYYYSADDWMNKYATTEDRS